MQRTIHHRKCNKFIYTLKKWSFPYFCPIYFAELFHSSCLAQCNTTPCYFERYNERTTILFFFFYIVWTKKKKEFSFSLDWMSAQSKTVANTTVLHEFAITTEWLTGWLAALALSIVLCTCYVFFFLHFRCRLISCVCVSVWNVLCPTAITSNITHNSNSFSHRRFYRSNRLLNFCLLYTYTWWAILCVYTYRTDVIVNQNRKLLNNRETTSTISFILTHNTYTNIMCLFATQSNHKPTFHSMFESNSQGTSDAISIASIHFPLVIHFSLKHEHFTHAKQSLMFNNV